MNSILLHADRERAGRHHENCCHSYRVDVGDLIGHGAGERVDAGIPQLPRNRSVGHTLPQLGCCCLPLSASGSGFLRERSPSAYFEDPVGIEETVKLNAFGNESGPSGLVTCAQPGTIVAMEVFIEENVVAPEWITLELFRAAVDRSPAMLVAQEDPGEAVRDLFADLKQVHQLAGSRGAFDFEVVTVIQIEVQQRPDNERVR